MAAKKPPAFQFYAAEFLVDENVVLMSNQAVGCYIKLMAYCWREGSIPSDIEKIAKLCGEDGNAMTLLWQSISKCFSSVMSDASRLIHPRLEQEREKQAEHRKVRAEAGAKGAKAKWHKGEAVDGNAINLPMAKNGSSSSSSSSISTTTVVEKRGTKLPEDWLPDDELVRFCESERPDLRVSQVVARFRDYWLAVPGAKGRKTDWSRTWKNWVRNERAAHAQSRSFLDAQAETFAAFSGRSEEDADRDNSRTIDV